MSEVTISTAVLQSMVSRAVRGAGNNKLLPITSMLAISASNGKLTLITTDATNTLYVDEKVSGATDFYAVVPVELFSKLIAKFTCETVELTEDDALLTVVGNGTYTLEMPVEDNGVVQYPDPVSRLSDTASKLDDGVTVSVATLKSVFDTCSASVALTLEEPCYMGYYMLPDRCITTDTLKVCGMTAKLLDDTVLLTPEMMSLVSVFVDDTVRVRKSENYRLLESETCRLFGPVMDEIDEYSIDAISSLLYEDKYPQSCKLSRAMLLEVLDRVSLFVSTYENRAVTLTFGDEGVTVSNLKQSGSELIQYEDKKKKRKAFECLIDVQMLMVPLKAMHGDVIEVHYGLDNAIRIVDDNVTQVVSLLQ